MVFTFRAEHFISTEYPEVLVALSWIPVCACLVVQSYLTLCDPVDCSPLGSSVHRISRQEYWSGLPFPPPGDLPDPGIKPTSPALAGGFFTTAPCGKPLIDTFS